MNLPKNCTEEQLRNHILSQAPPTAPPLEITDVFIKRSRSDSTTFNENHSSSKKYNERGRQGTSHHTNDNAIRMAFVGFQTAAAGKFVVQYFNRTYFQSSRLLVEPAQSVRDAQLAFQEKEKKRNAKRVREETPAQEGKMKNGDRFQNGREPSSAGEPADASGPLVSAAEGEKTTFHSDNEERRQQFVKERSAATTGTSWSTELLLPDPTPAAQASLRTTEEEETEAPSSLERKGKKTKRESKKNEKKNTTTTLQQHSGEMEDRKEKDNEMREAEHFQRQQELEAVSEMDFLAQLGGGETEVADTTPSDITKTTPRTHPMLHVKGNDSPSSTERAMGVVIEGGAPSGVLEKTVPLTGVSSRSTEANAATPVDPEVLAFRTARVRLFNLPYVATESDIKQFVTSQVGPIEGLHIPLTKDSRQSKGAAFVRFCRPEDAVKCLTELQGSIFKGRLVRVMAAEEDPYQPAREEGKPGDRNGEDDNVHHMDGTKGVRASLPSRSSAFKEEKGSARRVQEEEMMMNMISEDGHSESTTRAPQSWNALYVDSSAAVQQVAKRMHLSAKDIVSVDSKGAATRAAIAEALLTSETQKVLGDEGISFDVLSSSSAQQLLRPRSATTILVKNVVLRSPEEAAALSRLFSKYGVLELTAFPQSGLFALLRFTQAQDAKVAFRRLSFKLFQGAPLYLEWAPVGSITAEEEEENDRVPVDSVSGKGTLYGIGEGKQSSREEEEEDDKNADASHALSATQVFTLYLSNTPFQLSEDDLYSFLLDACPRFSKEPEKYIKRTVYEKDKGRAFITLDSSSSMLYAQRQWNGKMLQQRVLQCVPSKANTVLPSSSAGVIVPSTKDVSKGKATDANAMGGKGEEEDEEEDIVPSHTLHARQQQSSSQSNVPPGCDPLKIVVKNLPFEATEKDVRALFSAFSEIRSVRLPRKAQQFSHHRENHHRGFAFVEFLSESEAVRAMETLRATHLYGRHLVLEYAKAA